MRDAALRRLISLKKAQESFLGFVQLLHPEWDIPWFHLEMIEALDLLERGELTNDVGEPVSNLLVNLPPRYSKSALCTLLFPTYYMGRDPRRHVMCASYNSILARDFGRAVRRQFVDFEMKAVFPEFALARGAKSADAMTTTQDGHYFSVGMGSTTSGRPATALIIDDPVKNRQSVMTAASRDDVWSYYTAALESRLQPGPNGAKPIRIVVLTRWHQDDLAGRIMSTESFKRGEWKHMNYPAILNDETQEVLWPERFSYASLVDKRNLDPVEFAALYQQQPYVAGGDLIKSSWWQWYTPDLAPEHYLAIIITADTALKAQEGADYTVFQSWGLSKTGDIFLLDQIRDRIDFPEQMRYLTSFGAKFKGKGLRAVYIEDLGGGVPLTQVMRQSTDLPIIPWRAFKDKEIRVRTTSPLIEAGRVFLPSSPPWVRDFVEECESFPSGTHDDQVDAMTMALDVLSRIPVTAHESADLGESLLARYNRDRTLVMGTEKARSLKSRVAGKALPDSWNGWGGG